VLNLQNHLSTISENSRLTISTMNMLKDFFVNLLSFASSSLS